MRATKDLRKLSRTELLEMLVEISQENEDIKADNAELRAELEDRRILVGKAGSIAEASMDLNGVFESAQSAAQQYLENIRRASADAEGTSKLIVEKARAEAENMRESARGECQAMIDKTKRACAAYREKAQRDSNLRLLPLRETDAYEYEDDDDVPVTYAERKGPRSIGKETSKKKKRRGLVSNFF